MNTRFGIHASPKSGVLKRARATVPVLTVVAAILLTPAPAPADEIAVQAVRAQTFEEVISTQIRADSARRLAAAREQANRTLRQLPARYEWQPWLEADILALCGAVEFDFHQVIGGTDQRNDAPSVRDAGGI